MPELCGQILGDNLDLLREPQPLELAGRLTADNCVAAALQFNAEASVEAAAPAREVVEVEWGRAPRFWCLWGALALFVVGAG